MDILSQIYKSEVQEKSQDLVFPMYRWHLKTLEKSHKSGNL